MMKFDKSLPCAFVLLLGCHQTRPTPANSTSQAQALASQPPTNISSSMLLCDAVTLKRAETLNRYALGSYNNGVITKAESEQLQKLSADLIACANKSAQIPPMAAASENLKKIKMQADSGIATRQMLLQAEQLVIDATFCENSLSHIKEIESILQKEADVGFRSIVDFIPVLKKRLVLNNVCTQ